VTKPPLLVQRSAAPLGLEPTVVEPSAEMVWGEKLPPSAMNIGVALEIPAKLEAKPATHNAGNARDQTLRRDILLSS
jgi:hypothetical protein